MKTFLVLVTTLLLGSVSDARAGNHRRGGVNVQSAGGVQVQVNQGGLFRRPQVTVNNFGGGPAIRVNNFGHGRGGVRVDSFGRVFNANSFQFQSVPVYQGGFQFQTVSPFAVPVCPPCGPYGVQTFGIQSFGFGY